MASSLSPPRHRAAIFLELDRTCAPLLFVSCKPREHKSKVHVDSSSAARSLRIRNSQPPPRVVVLLCLVLRQNADFAYVSRTVSDLSARLDNCPVSASDTIPSARSTTQREFSSSDRRASVRYLICCFLARRRRACEPSPSCCRRRIPMS